MGDRPILVLDFDGVIHSYKSGWQGADVISDPPVDGAIEFLYEAVRHFDVCIFSSRSCQGGGIEAVRRWLHIHDTVWRFGRGLSSPALVEVIKFPKEKPPAHVTLDDRGWLFTGVWPDMDELLQFKPWYKAGR